MFLKKVLAAIVQSENIKKMIKQTIDQVPRNIK